MSACPLLSRRTIDWSLNVDSPPMAPLELKCGVMVQSRGAQEPWGMVGCYEEWEPWGMVGSYGVCELWGSSGKLQGVGALGW